MKNFFSLRFVTEEKVLEIEVEVGVADGYEIPFLGEGFSIKNRIEIENFRFYSQGNRTWKANQAI